MLGSVGKESIFGVVYPLDALTSRAPLTLVRSPKGEEGGGGASPCGGGGGGGGGPKLAPR